MSATVAIESDEVLITAKGVAIAARRCADSEIRFAFSHYVDYGTEAAVQRLVDVTGMPKPQAVRIIGITLLSLDALS